MRELGLALFQLCNRECGADQANMSEPLGKVAQSRSRSGIDFFPVQAKVVAIIQEPPK